ncbi:NAD(P)/FAD-dependent oxidoreductase [bacterium]|nr:NAD(P)/FAD-dependent oxidoreductase [bacterium]
MKDYDVIIIGAGNGGLTAGAKLAKEGASVLLLERHNIPGGSATSFCRGRFEFEVALHQLSGMGSVAQPGPLRGILQDLNVMEKLEFVEMDDLYRVQIKSENFNLTLRPDISKVVDELQQRFPHEKQAIKNFFDFLYLFFTEVIGAYYLHDPETSPEKYPLYFRYALKSTQQVFDEFFKDPLLKAVISPYWTYIGLPPSFMNFSDLAAMFFGFCEFKPYHLKGGSQALSNALADTITQNKGKIRYNCGVDKIIVKNSKTEGIITEHGDEITSKFVISNASKITTYVDLVGADHIPEVVTRELKQSRVAQSGFILYMGLDCEPDVVGITESTNFIFGNIDMDKAYQQMKVLDINSQDAMVLSCYDLRDPEFSPPGASQVALVTLKYGHPWLSVPPEQYADQKYRCADQMLNVIAPLYPELRNHIEEVEVATPITCMRYLGHPTGSIYGFEHHIKDTENFIPNKMHINGLLGVGGWVGLCGFQPTLESGVIAARSVLRQLGRN